MKGHEHKAALPNNWTKQGTTIYCLGCRRDIAAEAGLEGHPEATTLAEKVKIQARARVDFELTRDTNGDDPRPDGEIAKACHTSVAAVRKAKERLAS